MSQGVLGGKVAVVTGGSRGIGRASALAFAEAGADVAICHLGDAENAATLVQAVAARGRRAFAQEVEVASPAATRAFAAAAEAALGPCDILLNNAGINIRGPFESFTEESYDRVIDVHLKGMFFMAQAVYGGMVARGFGRIINIASQLALKGGPNAAPYCAAKAGIIGFTRALAFEAAPRGVLVNAIAPGPIDTDLNRDQVEWRQRITATLPMGRLGKVEEIAATALLLAGPGGDYYCGATLSPNGGDVMY
ncbi:SDR family NAD(P)-dependent oxidoreductase [Siccirubricoccus sp. KC 17139]|uniref:SDR family NAD(P)-dependent oxidoreductase n=1 Tax=Siccirubricoccus soli TaxID=2899147 RepID=A0ABT1DC19_9PROT|nr:SDR family NAD(P)-dependent oxidoreductase [Siccirubricoccus soli]MCO6419483.1 SDR family NAD(P)-dependent oxidoreductase [Siccirubricoccus soli]MCP2685618.1 SDR family NAD(P)-dependent oxidoreductase [Siccirubricoccus soli]